LVFLVLGNDNSNGVDIASVIANIARSQGALVLGVTNVWHKLEKSVDAIIHFCIEKTEENSDNFLMQCASSMYMPVAKLIDIIVNNEISFDFADMKCMFKNAGEIALLNIPSCKRENIKECLNAAFIYPCFTVDEYKHTKSFLVDIEIGPETDWKSIVEDIDEICGFLASQRFQGKIQCAVTRKVKPSDERKITMFAV
jgi:cell division GTPase FtsZ